MDGTVDKGFWRGRLCCHHFEVPVKLDHTSFIDGYIESTRVLIEQKGRNIDLTKGYR